MLTSGVCGFYGGWAIPQVQQSTAYKELFHVEITAHLWGSQWTRRHILFHSDNAAMIAILCARSSKVPVLMHLLRELLHCAARFGFTFTSCHVPGLQKKIADALSRFHWQEFRQLAPEAQPSPCQIPQPLLDRLISVC